MSKQYELSILRQALQDIKLRVGEMEEWLNESSEKPGEPMLEVGQKVLVMRGKEYGPLPDGIYTITHIDNGLITWGNRGYRYSVEGQPRLYLVPKYYDTVQPLLSGPFDASRIPADKVPGYMVWVESTSLAVKTGWHPIIQMCHDGGSRGVCIDGELGFRWYEFDGKGPVYGVTLHFQPPEKVNAEPSDELLLRVIEEMPWVVEWCKSGKCENGSHHVNCPHCGECQRVGSVCFRIFGTYRDSSGCPRLNKSIGKDRLQSVKSRIVTLAEEKRTYKVGDCFRGPYGIYKLQATGDGKIVWANCETGDAHSGPWDAENFRAITKMELQYPSEFTYLGPFSEVFTRSRFCNDRK